MSDNIRVDLIPTVTDPSTIDWEALTGGGDLNPDMILPRVTAPTVTDPSSGITPTVDVIRPPWMTDAMYNEWLGYYLNAGGDAVPNANNRALELFRNSSNYESYFPGIKRDDGVIRYSNNPEQTYYNNMEGYRNAIEGTGITDTSYFNEKLISLIEGDVSVNEFSQRTSAIFNRVLNAGDSIRSYYQQHFAIDMSDAAIVASLLDEQVGTDILNRNISIAEIGGEAQVRDFNLTRDFVETLVDVGGMDRREAQQFFGSAEVLLPTLSALAARHGDAKDEFDLLDLAKAQGFAGSGDGQLQRLGRLQAQESSDFTGGAQLDFIRDERSGGVAGLSTT